MDIGPSDTEDKEPSSTDEGNSNSGANNADDKEEEKGGPNVAIIGAAAAAAVLAAIGGGWYLWKRNKRNKEIAKENGWGGEGEYKRFTSDSLASAYLPHNDAYGDQDGRRGSEESWRGAGDGRRGDERGSYSSFIQAYSGQNGDSRVQSGAYPAFQNPSTTNLHIDQISGGSHGMGRHGSPTRYNGGYSPGGPSNYQNNSGYSPGGPSNYRNNGNARQYRPDSYNI
ncbi:hypothetical protein LPJ56_005574 [Coemansia sp. RSA 2599]|nr:hypothetical protein LPJ56_005574 [Coemansia sp. RSA 2599]